MLPMQDSRPQDQQSKKQWHDNGRYEPVGQAETGHGRSLLIGGSVSLPSVTGRGHAKDGDPQQYADMSSIARGKSIERPCREETDSYSRWNGAWLFFDQF